MSAACLNSEQPSVQYRETRGLLVRRLLLLSGGLHLAVAILKARSKWWAGDTSLLHAVSVEVKAYESWQDPYEC